MSASPLQPEQSAPESPARPAPPEQSGPESSAGLLQHARKLAGEGRKKEALRLLRRQVETATQDIAILEFFGRMLMEEQEYGEAAGAHQRLVDMEPENTRYLNALATCLTMIDMLEQATEVLDKAIRLNPASVVYRSNQGKLLLMQNRWSEALPHLETALSMSQSGADRQIQQWLDFCRGKMAEAPPGMVQEGSAPEDRGREQAQPAPQAPEGQGFVWQAPPAPAEPAYQGFTWSAEAEAAPAPLPVPAAFEPAPPALKKAPTATVPLGLADRPLNILFVQDVPCIRNYKIARALGRRGHKVTLAYARAKLSQVYKGLSDDVYQISIHLQSLRQLWEMSKPFDLVHCHNEPDIWTVAALAGPRPVVHDTHDLISLRQAGDQNIAFFEAVANRGAAGRVYTTRYQMEAAQRLHGVEGPCLVFQNYVSEGDLPREWLPKVSARDGKVHIVYEGGIGGTAHRDFREIFRELARLGLVVHIYPAHWNPEVAQAFAGEPGIVMHQPVSPTQLIGEMSQYDFGIIPWNLEQGNRDFLDTTIANKLFEYLAAGLPVAASPLKSYVDYFAENPVGLTFQTPLELAGQVGRLQEMARTIDFSRQIFTHEGEITRLEEFYYSLLDNPASRG